MIGTDTLASTADNGRRDRWQTYGLMVAILVLATLMRAFLLQSAPGWYADEGSDIEIATHLMRGEQRYFAIGQSTLVTGRLPLSHLALAGLLPLLGRDILTLRLLTAGYGVVIVLLLFVLGRRMWGTNLALLAAVMYALYPNAVLYNRFGFMYNQIALLYLLVFYTLWRFIDGASEWWLVGTCLAVGMSLTTNVASLPIVGFVVIVLFFSRRSALWWAVLLMAFLPAAYAMWMLTLAPQAFLQDLRYITLERVGAGLFSKVFHAVWNYKQLLLWDAWLPLGAFGLTRLNPSQNRLYTQAFFWYGLFTIASGVPAFTGIGYHYVIPLFPWVAVGLAAFLMWGAPRLVAVLENVYDHLYGQLPWAGAAGNWNILLRRHGRTWAVGLVLLWMVISPFLAIAVQARFKPGSLWPYSSPELERVTIRDTDDAEAAVAYINANVTADDLVLAPPHVAWMIKAQAADFQQSVAYMGGATQNYPRDIGRDRFLFDCSLHNARYALLWDGWQEWAGDKMPDLEVAFQTIDEWPIVYQSGEWRVFANPLKGGPLH